MVLLTVIGCRNSTSQSSAPEINASTTDGSPSILESPVSENETQIALLEPSDEDLAQAAKYRQQGLDYRGQKRYEEAIEVLQLAVNLDPKNLSGRVILGWTLHLAGQAEAASEALQQALEQDASHVPALNALGIVYLVEGQLELAVETHTRAITLKPDNEIGYYNLSLAYHRLQDYEQAMINAEQATILEPGNPHPWVALAIARWGHQAENTQDTDNIAQEAYQQAIDLDPRYLEFWFLDHLQQAGFSSEQIQTTDQLRQLF